MDLIFIAVLAGLVAATELLIRLCAKLQSSPRGRP
jgi:hypothetical protein